MKMFLASIAKDPKSIVELKKFVGGFEGKRLAYIPTAGNGEGLGSWKQGGSWALVNTLKANLKLIELEEYNQKEVMDDLRGSEIIWFAGGSAGYLGYWTTRTGLDKNLKSLLESGTKYVGSSAGSMVASKMMSVADWYIGEAEVGASNVPGLGLVDFDIYPHYDEQYLDQIKEKYKGSKLYLLKDGEEIIVDGDSITVIGEERIIS